MKKKTAAAALLAGALLGLCSCVDTKSITIATPDFSLIQDGVYVGESKVGPVFAKVSVRMDSGRIADFTILEHRNMRGKPAETLARLVVERQTLELDAVSGATASSKAILKAGENALESAMK